MNTQSAHEENTTTSEPSIPKALGPTAEPSIDIDKAQVQQHANEQKSKSFFSQVCMLLHKLRRTCLTHLFAHLCSVLFAGPLRMLFGLTILLAITLFIPKSKILYTQDYPYTLRVVSPQNQRVFASLSPFGVGFEYDLVTLFASQAGYTVQWLQEDKSSTALAMLQNNKADLVVGFPELDYGEDVVASPIYMHGQSVAVHLRHEKVDQYKALAEARKNANSEGYARAKVNDQYDDELYKGESIVTDVASWQLWQPFAREHATALPLDDITSYRWYWNAKNDKLNAQAELFWYLRTKEGDTVLVDLNEHYFNFMRMDIDPLELRNLERVIKTRLPRYQKTINDAAKRYHIDPLLLTAVIFQESHFDPDAISYTGVRGIMQLTQATADLLGVDRLNPHQSIEGGARYLRLLWDGLADVGLGEDTDGDPDAIQTHGSQPKLLGLTDWNRWCFTLAAFNQGRGHLRDAIRLSKSLGGSGLTWYELKNVYPLMAKKEFYSKLRYGPCRGDEAVQFVDNIRWYYYILSGTAVLSEGD